MIDRQAPAQRSGVLASLNMIADTLKLLPQKETAARWSAAEWSKRRKGWLFLGAPETRKRLPLTSLSLDTLVLRLMDQGTDVLGQTSPRKVWFVLDELASSAVTPIAYGHHGKPPVE